MEWQSFLTADEHCYLTTPERIDLGAYRAWGTERRDCEFVVELDTRPLAVLAESAALGSRVYEFMSIQRPGDILHYLRVQLSSVDDEVTRYVVERIKDTDRECQNFCV
ncbi:MAG: hypothetical protein RBS05_21820 [Zoogloea oleivorans]|jgi:hypothetical protein|uniref:hypothetical protein n=1 Tax=Zoogloea oleivorans TaxID=1552750 RepID=UPI002A360C7F|nr:hypothetical protein [Zoogloea oleivorans]MDY0038551.1 hypothetical protein [Zoogloea oleivorans]